MAWMTLEDTDLDAPISTPDTINFIKEDMVSAEPVLKKTKRGILEAALRLQKKRPSIPNGLNRTVAWILNDKGAILRTNVRSLSSVSIFIYSSYIPGTISIFGPRRPEGLKYLVETPRYKLAETTRATLYLNSKRYGDGTDLYKFRSSIATRDFSYRNYTCANLQYINAEGLWYYVPVFILTHKTRAKKNNRPLLFGEVITTQQTEEVYTFLVPLEVLYDTPHYSGDAELFWRSRELLYSPVVYCVTETHQYGSYNWQRLAITTTDAVLHSDKPRAYITLEAVVVKEILDS